MSGIERIRSLVAVPSDAQLPWTDLSPIVIDGAAIPVETLVHSEPRMSADYSEASVVEPPHVWHSTLARLEQEWLSRNPAARNDPKVSLVELRLTNRDRPCYVFTVAFTRWSQVRAVHESLAGAIRRPPWGVGEFWPNILSLHVIVRTLDDLVVISQRALKVAYHPGSISCSLEEGVEPSDLDADRQWLYAAAARGVNEELLWPNAIGVGDITILGPMMEVGIQNPALAAIATIPYSAADLKHLARAAPDAGEASGTPAFLSTEPKTVGDLLLQRTGVAARANRSPWHPTSRARLLLFLVHQIGVQEAVRVLARQA